MIARKRGKAAGEPAARREKFPEWGRFLPLTSIGELLNAPMNLCLYVKRAFYLITPLKPVRELHPLESSAFHDALLRQLRVELFPMCFSLKVEGYAKRRNERSHTKQC